MKTLKDSTITVRLPATLKASVERLAEIDDRSLSQVVLVAVKEYVARHEHGERGTASVRGRRAP